METPQTAMVVLASEQLWPNIQGLVHWQQSASGLSDLCIYYTNDEPRSVRPAQRLAALCGKLFPEVQVHLPAEPGGIQPCDVSRAVNRWREQLPGRQWVLNATGGLKLMFAGVVDLTGEAGVEIVYRELSGDWFRITRNGGTATESFAIDASETDGIDALDLIETQWDSPDPGTWTAGRPEPLNVATLTQAGLECGWNWQRTFSAAGHSANDRTGMLFERFVAAVLVELGVSGVRTNIELYSSAETNKQRLQEIDIACNQRGRLLLIDCKLKGIDDEEFGMVESITSQIRQAAITQRHLGGLKAEMILVRPARTFKNAERLLCEAYRIQLIDQTQGWDFLPLLARFVGVKRLPDSLATAQQRLEFARDSGAPFPFRQDNYTPRRSPAEPGQSVFNVQQAIAEFRERRARNWVAWSYRPWHQDIVHIESPLPDGYGEDEIRTRLVEVVHGHAALGRIDISRTGSSFKCNLFPGSRRAKDLLLRRLDELSAESFFD